MPIQNIFNTGQTGMNAHRAALATTGHNIANASTEGFSRQRVITEATAPRGNGIGKNTIGTGVRIGRVERINDEYIEKQVRNAQRDLSHFEEKDIALKQLEDIFNEMNGDGLNRLVSRFFNEFRRLADEPENPAVRQSVREASQSMINDFRRIRKNVEDVRNHLDSRIEGCTVEANSLSKQLAELNQEITEAEAIGGVPNDLLDKRDGVLKKLTSYMDVSMHKNNFGHFNVDMKGIGPWVNGVFAEKLNVERSPADDLGKPEQAYDVLSSGNARSVITHQIQGGKLGALLDVRDRTLSTVLSRLDDLAYNLSEAVNSVHSQGITPGGLQGIMYFKPMDQKERAAEFIALSDEVQSNVNHIATALIPDAPGDNRVAIAISHLQGQRILGDEQATADEWYNSIISEVGVASSRNRFSLNQQRDIMTQLNKVRDQLSGVSIDEETANLLQFQHAFDASAKVIQVADELMKTVLSIKS